jgi:hypothetical protein
MDTDSLSRKVLNKRIFFNFPFHNKALDINMMSDKLIIERLSNRESKSHKPSNVITVKSFSPIGIFHMTIFVQKLTAIKTIQVIFT